MHVGWQLRKMKLAGAGELNYFGILTQMLSMTIFYEFAEVFCGS
jgi:hypothetical protein